MADFAQIKGVQFLSSYLDAWTKGRHVYGCCSLGQGRWDGNKDIWRTAERGRWRVKGDGDGGGFRPSGALPSPAQYVSFWVSCFVSWCVSVFWEGGGACSQAALPRPVRVGTDAAPGVVRTRCGVIEKGDGDGGHAEEQEKRRDVRPRVVNHGVEGKRGRVRGGRNDGVLVEGLGSER